MYFFNKKYVKYQGQKVKYQHKDHMIKALYTHCWKVINKVNIFKSRPNS